MLERKFLSHPCSLGRQPRLRFAVARIRAIFPLVALAFRIRERNLRSSIDPRQRLLALVYNLRLLGYSRLVIFFPFDFSFGLREKVFGFKIHILKFLVTLTQGGRPVDPPTSFVKCHLPLPLN